MDVAVATQYPINAQQPASAFERREIQRMEIEPKNEIAADVNAIPEFCALQLYTVDFLLTRSKVIARLIVTIALAR